MPIQEDAFEYILDCGTEGILIVCEGDEYLLLSSSERVSSRALTALHSHSDVSAKKVLHKEIEEASKTSYDVIDLDDCLSEDMSSKEMFRVLDGLLEHIRKGAPIKEKNE